MPEALTETIVRVPNEPEAQIPEDLSKYQQILLEKQTLDIFQSRHAEELVQKLGKRAEFLVFGVVTEYCVNFAARGLLQRGRRVAIVRDAIETLREEDGENALAELRSAGARLTTTEQALSDLGG